MVDTQKLPWFVILCVLYFELFWAVPKGVTWTLKNPKNANSGPTVPPQHAVGDLLPGAKWLSKSLRVKPQPVSAFRLTWFQLGDSSNCSTESTNYFLCVCVRGNLYLYYIFVILSTIKHWKPYPSYPWKLKSVWKCRWPDQLTRSLPFPSVTLVHFERPCRRWDSQAPC